MAVIASVIKQQFFGTNGKPLAGGKLATLAAGTETPQPVYQDPAGTVPHTNPVILDSRGEVTYFVTDAPYKFRLLTPTNVEIYTVDNITAPTAVANALRADLASTAVDKGASLIGYNPVQAYSQGLGQFLNYIFGRTAAEVAAGVLPTNYAFFPGDPRRYGAVGDGSTDNVVAFTKWCKVGGRMHLPAGIWHSTGNDGAALRFYVGGIHLTADPLAVLKPIGWIDAVNVADVNYPAVLTQLYKVTIENLTVDGDLQLAGPDDTYGNGINVTAVDIVNVRFNRLINVKNQVIVSTYYGIDTIQKTIDVSHNYIDGVRLNQIGVGLEGQAESAVVVGNRIFNCVGDGVQASYNGGGGRRGTMVINDNNITGPTGGSGRGIYVGDNIYDVVIDGNMIKGLDISIRATSLSTSTFDYLITSNKCYDWTSGGIVVFPLAGADNSEALVDGNHCKSSVASISSSGIYVGKNATVTANKVRSGAVGIRTTGSDQFIAGNDLVGPTVCLDVTMSTGAVVTNNRTITVPGLAADTIYSPPPGFGGSISSASAITLPVQGDIFKITGTTNITSLAATSCQGRSVRLVFTGALTVINGTNLRLSSDFTTTADATLTLSCDGVNWFEVARSAN